MNIRRNLLWPGVFTLGLLIGGLSLDGWHRYHHDLPSRRVEATVYVPLVDNADQTVPTAKWHDAVEPLIREFGGATLGAPTEGLWKDAKGEMRREPVRPVIISFERTRLAEFRLALREVGRRLGQEAMYVRFEEPRVELLPVGADSEKDR